MGTPLTSSGIARVALVAGCLFCQNGALAQDTAGSPDVLAIRIGERVVSQLEAGGGVNDHPSRSSGQSATSLDSRRETKGGERKEMARGDDLFILFLQILRSPR